MRNLFTVIIFFISSCSNPENKGNDNSAISTIDTPPSINTSSVEDTVSGPMVYSNTRFRNVVVNKVEQDFYKITGEGQIFEASFNWVVEDGHNELKSGYTTTDAGAPGWGKFEFTVNVPKARANSVLTMILFEASAEDGRRTHELPISL